MCGHYRVLCVQKQNAHFSLLVKTLREINPTSLVGEGRMLAVTAQQLTATVYLIQLTEWEKLRHSEVRESGESVCVRVCVGLNF